jgi:ubiquitin carboxyl-terminal hydrolase 5/13
MFKSLVGKDHAEFSTMKQQDAGEFVIHLLEYVRRAAKQAGTDEVTSIFGFAVEERLECTECHGVRYKTENQELLSMQVPIKKKEEVAAMEVETEGEKPAGVAKKEEEGEKKVEYEPVELTSVLTSFTNPTEVDGYSCPRCEKKTTAIKCVPSCLSSSLSSLTRLSAIRTTRFSTFPDVLLLNANRFQMENWVPRKVDVPLILPSSELDLAPYIGKGLQEGEVELPGDAAGLSPSLLSPSLVDADGSSITAAPAEHQFDADSMNQLTGMGFPEVRAKRALLATGHNGADVAMNWLFEHMEDPGSS